MKYNPIVLDHAAQDVEILTGHINALEMEAAESGEPGAFVLAIAVVEAERDVALRLVSLQRALLRFQKALAALD